MIKKAEEKQEKKILKTNQNKNNNHIPEICPECGGREFILTPDNRAVPCSCRNKNIFIKRLEESRIPQKFLDKGLDNYTTPDKDRKRILEEAKQIVASFNPDKKEKQGVLLRGGVGTGKTHIAIGILKDVIEKGYTGIYANIPELLSRLRHTYNQGSDETELDIIETITDCDMAVLDDLGAEMTTGWVRDRLYLIINALYEKNKTIIVTTNCTLDELSNQVGPRIASRICELCHELPEFPDKDYRRLMMK